MLSFEMLGIFLSVLSISDIMSRRDHVSSLVVYCPVIDLVKLATAVQVVKLRAVEALVVELEGHNVEVSLALDGLPQILDAVICTRISVSNTVPGVV